MCHQVLIKHTEKKFPTPTAPNLNKQTQQTNKQNQTKPLDQILHIPTRGLAARVTTKILIGFFLVICIILYELVRDTTFCPKLQELSQYSYSYEENKEIFILLFQLTFPRSSRSGLPLKGWAPGAKNDSKASRAMPSASATQTHSTRDKWVW